MVFFSQLQQRSRNKSPELKNSGCHVLGSYKPLKNAFQKGNSQHEIQKGNIQHEIQKCFLRRTYASE